jgi:hypothetical protein
LIGPGAASGLETSEGFAAGRLDPARPALGRGLEGFDRRRAAVVNVKHFSHPCGKDISQEHGKEISHPYGKQFSHSPLE